MTLTFFRGLTIHEKITKFLKYKQPINLKETLKSDTLIIENIHMLS